MTRKQGSNQYKSKYRVNKVKGWLFLTFLLLSLAFAATEQFRDDRIIKSVISVEFSKPIVQAVEVTNLKVVMVTHTPTPTPTISELENVVSYITRVFEPEGKSVVIKAINCFYSESGLRPDAQGWNPPKLNPDGTVKEPASYDNGVAQLNDYWHNLTPKEKVDIKANIDRAYKIYKGRGNFSAWYGKLCN